MIITKSCRLYPTPLQEECFWLAVRTYNHMWNRAKSWCDSYYEANHSIMPKRELNSKVAGYKREWLETARFKLEHHTFREGAFNYYQSLMSAIRGKRGFPKWKHGRYQRVRSFMVRTDGSWKYGIFKNGSNYLSIPGLSKVDPKRKYVKSNIMKTDYSYGERGFLAARVVFDGKYWNLQYTIEVSPTKPETMGDPIGLDVGVKHYVTTNKGVHYDVMMKDRKYVKLTNRVKGYQRKLARQRKNRGYLESNNYWKTRKRLLMVERNLAEYKKSYVIKIAKDILKDNPSVVAMETLSIPKMKSSASKKLRSNIHQVGWYTLKMRIAHEVDKYGGTLFEAPQYFPSTKRCNKCGNVKDMPLYRRTYYCHVCGNIDDRDVNAAKNLVGLAAKSFPLSDFRLVESS